MVDIILSSGLIPIGLICLALCFIAFIDAEKSNKKGIVANVFNTERSIAHCHLGYLIKSRHSHIVSAYNIPTQNTHRQGNPS